MYVEKGYYEIHNFANLLLVVVEVIEMPNSSRMFRHGSTFSNSP